MSSNRQSFNKNTKIVQQIIAICNLRKTYLSTSIYMFLKRLLCLFFIPFIQYFQSIIDFMSTTCRITFNMHVEGYTFLLSLLYISNITATNIQTLIICAFIDTIFEN